jgi:Na+/H+-dicarboxylate symporter
MGFAPAGVFGAVAAAITVQGPGVLATYGKCIGAFDGAMQTWLLAGPGRNWHSATGAA